MPYNKVQRFLTVKGQSKAVKGVALEVFDWNNALIDSSIIAALTFFTSLAGITITEFASGAAACVPAAVSAAIQFFTLLAIKRGLRQKTEVAK